MIIMLSIYDHSLGLVVVNTKTICCTVSFQDMFNRATSSA
ncbi:unnamed protein product [Callosobruchus maculatus]|uniref:Uncharacterized protein n=1 Tax=Callosobruchus maculatus TaxID=64391 RepID=A0A653DSK7_CALMS|nr:unnamed protein product [Callosobruchus maculatus]